MKYGAVAVMLAVVTALAVRSDHPINYFRAGEATGTVLLICFVVWLVRRLVDGPRRRRQASFARTPTSSVRGLIVWVAALALLTTAGVADYIRRTPSYRTVLLPESFGGYTKFASPASTQAINLVRSKLPSEASHAPIALYALRGSTPTLLVAALYADLGGDVASELQDKGPNAALLSFFAGAGVNPSDQFYAPGPLGGVLKCGNGTNGTATSVVCGWADGSTLAVVIDGSPDADADQLAAITLELRGAAEH